MSDTTEKVSKNVDLLWGVKIPMRDGVELNATIFLPQERPQPLPVILTLTPYIADGSTPRAMYFARNGYAYAMVDSRGRGNSGGEFEPLINEPQDGHDIVEWLAVQPWCDGKVTMWGGSYAGYDQWAALKENPTHLATIVPVAAAHPGVDFPVQYNICYPYEMQWLTLVSGVTGNSTIFNTSEFWIQKFTELFRQNRPLMELDQIVGNTTSHFQTILNHTHPDAYLDRMVPQPEDYARFNIPILTITGHYDGDQPGALHFYRQHMRYGNESCKQNHYLIIGPWDHAGTRTPQKEFGGLKFGDASMIDMNKLHKEWYDWTLKSGSKPEFLKERVAYYVCGAEEWKYAPSLEDISKEKWTLYLGSPDGKANDIFRSGTLNPGNDSPSASDSYVYDPLDTRIADFEQEEIKNPYTDQRYVLNLFGAGLVYHSQPFEEPVEISGCPRLQVWLSMDVPDTDFHALLYEIQPDGTSILLTDAQMRARYRQSLRKASLVPLGEIICYDLSNFQFFSRRVAKGSRLRLVFKAPNSIYAEKNYNSGGMVEKESGKDARTAHVNLYHDAQHPSFIELPVVK